MAYTTVQEVEADFKDTVFSSVSNVLADEVTQFIVEADALINAYVGMVYTVPVTAGAGLNLLKLLSRSLVAIRVKGVLEVKQVIISDANQAVLATLFSTKQVMEILKDIRDKNISLEGASGLVSNSGFYSQNYSEDIEPVMKKDTRQW